MSSVPNITVSERHWTDADPSHFPKPTAKRLLMVEGESAVAGGRMVIEAELEEDAGNPERRLVTLLLWTSGRDASGKPVAADAHVHLCLAPEALPQFAAVVQRLSDEAIARGWAEPIERV